MQMTNRAILPVVGWILIAWLLIAYGITIYQHGAPIGPGEGNHGNWRASWYRYHYEYMLFVPVIAVAVGLASLKGFRRNGTLITLGGLFFLFLAFACFTGID